MPFLIDRCAGTFIAEWLRTQGHDVVESRERGRDPGDRVLLEWAVQESRILITIDTDFGQLVFLEGQSHSGLIRLPDVSSSERVVIIKDLIERFQKELESQAIITVRGGKIRISASSEWDTRFAGLRYQCRRALHVITASLKDGASRVITHHPSLITHHSSLVGGSNRPRRAEV